MQIDIYDKLYNYLLDNNIGVIPGDNGFEMYFNLFETNANISTSGEGFISINETSGSPVNVGNKTINSGVQFIIYGGNRKVVREKAYEIYNLLYGYGGKFLETNGFYVENITFTQVPFFLSEDEAGNVRYSFNGIIRYTDGDALWQ